jgi:hypothetical protein
MEKDDVTVLTVISGEQKETHLSQIYSPNYQYSVFLLLLFYFIYWFLKTGFPGWPGNQKITDLHYHSQSQCFFKSNKPQEIVAHTYNPSYLGGRDREDPWLDTSPSKRDTVV